MLRILFQLLVVLFVASPAFASHFRFGHITWSLVSNNPDGSVTVKFTSTQAWRATSIGTLEIEYGDGGFTDLNSVTVSELGPFTDLNGEDYVITIYEDTHTYASAGPWVASISSCCRIGSLINAGSASELVQTVVDVSNGNLGSPVSSIPVILQMSQGQANSLLIPVADPQGEPFNCRMATASESEIPTVASAGGNVLTVDSGCVLSWDTSLTTIGQKYAAQVVIEETNRCGITPVNSGASGPNGYCGSVALDFIIEIVEGNVPTCTSDKPVNNVVSVGSTFTANLTGTDSDPGEVLTITHSALPSGATLTPPSGTSQTAPMNAVFQWTPSAAQVNTANAFTITYTDSVGLQGICSLSIQVPPNQAPTCVIDTAVLQNVDCQGVETKLTLDGSGSTDPDNDDLTYTWATNCGNSSIANDVNAVTDLTLFDPGLGVAAACNVTLTVSDGIEMTACESTVSSPACGLDCSGAPLGIKIFDQCGICGGDGQSCLDCGETINTTEASLEMDGGLSHANSLLNKAYKRAKKKGVSKKKLDQIKEILAVGDSLYQQGWSLSWMFPPEVKQCNNQTLCVTSDNSGTVSDYISASAQYIDLLNQIVKKFPGSSKKLKKAMKRQHQKNIDAANSQPLFTSTCS